MIKVSVTHNCRPLNAEQFKRDVMDHAMNGATANLESKVRGLRCPVHLKPATVNRTATGWAVQSCCQTMKDAVDARLKR